MRPARVSDDKQRVPRTEKSRSKSGSGESSSSRGDDDHSGFFDSCFQGCFDNCADTFVESLFSRPKPAPVPPAAERALAAEPRTWHVSDHGWIVTNAPGDSVVLWRDIAGPGESDVEAGRLPDGAEVVIEEIHVLPNETELRVRPVNRVEPAGWVAAAALAAGPGQAGAPLAPPSPTQASPGGPQPAAPAVAQVARPAPRALPRPLPARWAIQLAVGGGFFGKKDLAFEYDEKGDGQAYAEAHYVRFSPGLMWGAGVGYREAWGKPQVDYLTPEAIDEPHDSHWIATDFDLLVGQRYWYDNHGRLQWSIGPALFHVRENAEVRTYDTATQEYLGSRQEKLDRWTGGAKARLGFSWQPASTVDLGLQLDGYLMALDGRRRQSLAGDFVRGPLSGMDVALTVGFFGR